MNRFLTAFLLIVLPCSASALEPGTYTITFRIADMGFEQKVELLNFRESPNKSFIGVDVHLKEKGSLMRFPQDSQIVQGIIYGGKFKFIIPFANVTDVYSFSFVGINEIKEGTYNGSGEVFFNDPDKKDKFNFKMNKSAR